MTQNTVKISKTTLQRLKRDLILFLKNPKDFLYSFTYPADKYITIEAYDPRLTQIGTRLKQKINKMYPGLKVHFMGSAALRICGQKDIDYVVDCNPKNFNHYISGLISLFGQPKKIRPTFIEWETRQYDYHIDMLLMDSSNPVSIETLKIFKILSTNKKILKQYEQLKLASNGLSIREYKRVRMEFFQKILKK